MHKCLIIKEEYSDLILSNNKITIYFLDSHIDKMKEFINLYDFILHIYIKDKLSDVSIGINRYDGCEFVKLDKNCLILKYKGMKFYNNAQTHLLRQDKINNLFNI